MGSIVCLFNWLTTIIGKVLIHSRGVSLVNVLLQRSVYPELLGASATAKNIFREFNRITSDDKVRNQMIAELKSADKLWRPDDTSVGARIAADIKKSI